MSDYIGLAVWNFREGSVAERTERLVRMGFDAVSLSAGDAGALCRGLLPDLDAAIERHDLAVTIHASFAAGGEAVPAEALLEDFALFMKWHERTGALNSVNYDALSSRDEQGTQHYDAGAMASVLRRMLSASNGAGFSVGVEDWPRTREQFEGVKELASYPHYGILIDLGHLNLRVRKGLEPDSDFPTEAAQQYLDRIDLPVNEIHVHNNDGLKDRHAPPQSGTSDVAALARMLRRKGANCIATIEIVPAWCGLQEQEGWEAAQEALEFWRQAF